MAATIPRNLPNPGSASSQPIPSTAPFLHGHHRLWSRCIRRSVKPMSPSQRHKAPPCRAHSGLVADCGPRSNDRASPEKPPPSLVWIPRFPGVANFQTRTTGAVVSRESSPNDAGAMPANIPSIRILPSAVVQDPPIFLSVRFHAVKEDTVTLRLRKGSMQSEVRGRGATPMSLAGKPRGIRDDRAVHRRIGPGATSLGNNPGSAIHARAAG